MLIITVNYVIAHCIHTELIGQALMLIELLGYTEAMRREGRGSMSQTYIHPAPTEKDWFWGTFANMPILFFSTEISFNGLFTNRTKGASFRRTGEFTSATQREPSQRPQWGALSRAAFGLPIHTARRTPLQACCVMHHTIAKGSPLNNSLQERVKMGKKNKLFTNFQEACVCSKHRGRPLGGWVGVEGQRSGQD